MTHAHTYIHKQRIHTHSPARTHTNTNSWMDEHTRTELNGLVHTDRHTHRCTPSWADMYIHTHIYKHMHTHIQRERGWGVNWIRLTRTCKVAWIHARERVKRASTDRYKYTKLSGHTHTHTHTHTHIEQLTWCNDVCKLN